MSLDRSAIFTVTYALASEGDRNNSLDGVDTNFIKDGSFGWVQSGGAALTLFRYDASSSATADGVLVVAPLTGSGRWIMFQTPAAAQGTVVQSATVYPSDPGENFDVTTAAATQIPDGTGTTTTLQALLANDVRPDSVFKFSFFISKIIASVVGSGNAAVYIQPVVVAPDDPTPFPANVNPWDQQMGLLLGSAANVAGVVAPVTAYMSQAMMTSLLGQPVEGRVGMYLEAGLQGGEGSDTVRIPVFPSGFGSGDPCITVEEITGGPFSFSPAPP